MKASSSATSETLSSFSEVELESIAYDSGFVASFDEF
jgi:hypothetical protein